MLNLTTLLGTYPCQYNLTKENKGKMIYFVILLES